MAAEAGRIVQEVAMHAPGAGTGSTPEADDGARFARAFAAESAGYWRGPTAVSAWLLTLALGATVLMSIAGTVAVSSWNRWFFDALEARDGETALLALGAFLLLAAVLTGVSVGTVVSRETLQVRWRQWLTDRLVDTWLGERRFHRLKLLYPEVTNPEYRMAEDIRWATEPPVDFAMGLLTAVVSTVTFVGILWSVGGALALGGEDGVRIPAYMVLAALLQGGVVTVLMLKVGRLLPRQMAARNEAEAHFRFHLTLVRENAARVAHNGEEARERATLAQRYAAVVSRWLAVVRKDGQITWILTGNGILVPIVPILLATPKYLSDELSLGAVMQLAAAYVPVQAAIAWGVDNFRAISNWHASARRVVELVEAMRALDAAPEAEAAAIGVTVRV